MIKTFSREAWLPDMGPKKEEKKKEKKKEKCIIRVVA